MIKLSSKLLFMTQALRLEADSGGGASIAEDVLGIMETVLQEATSTPTPDIPIQQGDGSQLDMLLNRITSPYVVRYCLYIVSSLAFPSSTDRHQFLSINNSDQPLKGECGAKQDINQNFLIRTVYR